jgi:predicted RNase H-like nuclease (RuvC/YqgF family)
MYPEWVHNTLTNHVDDEVIEIIESTITNLREVVKKKEQKIQYLKNEIKQLKTKIDELTDKLELEQWSW